MFSSYTIGTAAFPSQQYAKQEMTELDQYPALYRIFDAKTETMLCIGETQNFGQRMKAHAQKNWNGRAPVVSYLLEHYGPGRCSGAGTIARNADGNLPAP
jgi:hypothetical protein